MSKFVSLQKMLFFHFYDELTSNHRCAENIFLYINASMCCFFLLIFCMAVSIRVRLPGLVWMSSSPPCFLIPCNECFSFFPVAKFFYSPLDKPWEILHHHWCMLRLSVDANITAQRPPVWTSVRRCYPLFAFTSVILNGLANSVNPSLELPLYAWWSDNSKAHCLNIAMSKAFVFFSIFQCFSRTETFQ